MGEIASDWRQHYNIWGAHVSVSNMDHNFRGIGICLIGNYEIKKVPAKQYLSLVTLTKKLMKKYDIKSTEISGHGMIPGESTKCPGKYFPIEKFKIDIQKS
ncbi:MAG: N-acetylmuramoyl-L-alanine amidase [bacterium]|nr:N-acetylmuramoyl-L-alanine amidase [bacterium]